MRRVSQNDNIKGLVKRFTTLMTHFEEWPLVKSAEPASIFRRTFEKS